MELHWLYNGDIVLLLDIDLFGNTEISSDEIVDILNAYGKVTTIKRSKTINVFIVNEIKVDFVNYKYPWLDPIKFVDGMNKNGDNERYCSYEDKCNYR